MSSEYGTSILYGKSKDDGVWECPVGGLFEEILEKEMKGVN